MIKKKKIISIAVGLLALAVGYYFLNSIIGFSIPCIFHKQTGFYCPGCGITRMLFSLFKLELYQAFRYNVLTFILLILCIIKFIYCLIFKKSFGFSEKTITIILIITILFGIARNIEAFSFLAPTII